MVTIEEVERQEKCPKTKYGSSPSSHPITEEIRDGVDHDIGTGTSDSSGKKRSSREKIMFLIDPDIFDCPICFEELSPPIFQCFRGHITCSSCRIKIKNTCPSCKKFIYCRNLAVENILESIKVPCPYAGSGCEQVISYANVRAHRKMCDYSPCHCPAADCTFQGPMRELYHHYTAEHSGCSIPLHYSRACSTTMDKDEHILVGHGDDGVLFLVLNKTELGIGNSVMVACLGPDSIAGKYTYKVKATDEKRVSSLQLESPMSSIRRWEGILPRKSFLLIPEVFDVLIELEITIWKEGNTGRTNTVTEKVSTPNTAQMSTPNTPTQTTQKVSTPNTATQKVSTPITVTQKVPTPNTAQMSTPNTPTQTTQKMSTPNTALVPTPNTATLKVPTPNTAQVPTPNTPTQTTQKMSTPNTALVPTPNTATQKVPTPNTAQVPTPNTPTQTTQKMSTPNTTLVPTPNTATQKVPTPNTAQVPTPNTPTQIAQKMSTPNTTLVPTPNIATQKMPTPNTAQVPTSNTANTAQVPTPNTATQKVPTPNTSHVPTSKIATQKVPTPSGIPSSGARTKLKNKYRRKARKPSYSLLPNGNCGEGAPIIRRGSEEL